MSINIVNSNLEIMFRPMMNMTTRTTGAIALRPTGNVQEGYYFFSLSTGRRIKRNSWTKLPMPSEVIARINQMTNGDCYNVDEDVANTKDNDVDESDLNFTDYINQDDLQLTYNSTDSPVCDNQTHNNNLEPVEDEIDENERAVNNFEYNQGIDLFHENENIINNLLLEEDESLVFTAEEETANDNTSEMDEKYGMRTS
jgi:hypothetical protein